jgi:Uma2 family endonuclease
MTVDELEAMPDDGWTYELVRGILVRMPPSSGGASQHQFAPGMTAKVRLYLSFGTRLVWIVWPRYKRVDIWRLGDETPKSLGIADTLDGEDVVPGFTYAVARLFP